MKPKCDVSVVIVSFNTRELLRKCLRAVGRECRGLAHQIIVVDNASSDGSAGMVELEFPSVHVIRSEVNLGFGAANNVAFQVTTGRYVVLINSDALLAEGALSEAVNRMDHHPEVGVGGGRLLGPDGTPQPSARQFPSLVNDFLALSGLAERYRNSRFFGRFDRTWADPNLEANVDWVPGAFSIIRADVLEQVGPFDERFFLYYEEVDFCRRVKQAGYSVRYWPTVRVVHIGGASIKNIEALEQSSSGTQLILWRMRSALLYYRKQHGIWGAWLAMQIEISWHRIRSLKNRLAIDSAKIRESSRVIELMKRAWSETARGTFSPPRPW